MDEIIQIQKQIIGLAERAQRIALELMQPELAAAATEADDYSNQESPASSLRFHRFPSPHG